LEFWSNKFNFKVASSWLFLLSQDVYLRARHRGVVKQRPGFIPIASALNNLPPRSADRIKETHKLKNCAQDNHDT